MFDDGVVAKKQTPCPYVKLVNLYHDELPGLPRVRMLDDDTRKRAARARWAQVIEINAKAGEPTDEAYVLEDFRKVFQRISRSDFLMGRCDPTGGRSSSFRADFDFIFRASGFRKILEGKYDNRNDNRR